MSDNVEAPDLKGTLGKRIGPLPVAGWLAAIGGGLAISWYLRRNGASNSDTAPADTVAPTTSATPGMGGAAVSDPTYPGNISAPVDTEDGTGTLGGPITSNAQWRQQAVKWLVGSGVGAIAAEMAVTNYLSGGTLSQAQADQINRAVAAIGPTPAPVPAISVAAPTPPPAKPTANPRPTTNAQWRLAAIKWLDAHGNSYAHATDMIDKFLSGHNNRNTANERRAVDLAIRAVGPPPQGIPKRRDTGKNTHPKR